MARDLLKDRGPIGPPCAPRKEHCEPGTVSCSLRLRLEMRLMIRTRLFTPLAAFVVFAMLLSACGASGTPADLAQSYGSSSSSSAAAAAQPYVPEGGRDPFTTRPGA